MSDLEERISALSPEKRKLLLHRLKRGKEPATGAVPVLDRSSNVFPLSFAQQRLWFLHQLDPSTPVYNIPLSIHLAGPLEADVLGRVLNEVVLRHEALRTRFEFQDGQPVQVIMPELPLTLQVNDLQGLAEGDRETALRRLERQEATTSFDLTSPPLVRAGLVRLGPEEHVLLLTMHHIVSDGWSMRVLFQDVCSLYRAFSHGEPSPLGALPVQYADFATWQRQRLQGDELERQLSFWRRQLADLPPRLDLPLDHGRPDRPTFQGGVESMELTRELTRRLVELGREEAATPFMVLLAGFQALLHRYSGSTKLAVGTPIANRNRSEIESLIGFFVNTLVIATDLSGNPSFRELVRRVRDTAVEAYDHQDLPFERLIEELRPERRLSVNPLMQVMFSLYDMPWPATEIPGLVMAARPVSTQTAKFDLTLAFSESEDGLQGEWEYNSDVFERETIRRMSGHLATLLTAAASNPDQPIATLPLLTEAERHQVLVEWNETQTEYPRDLCVHQLFEAQVERTPDAVAVAFENTTLTYRELNQRANQLAHRLHSMGVGPESIVGILMARSVEMVVGLLGILKAGGAYLPLDPTHPRQRLINMMEDARVTVLVTQAHLATGSDLAGCVSHVLRLDADQAAISQEIVDNLGAAVEPHNLAYVMYTSGSTGSPKGTMVPHRGLVNYLVWCTRAYRVTEGRGAPVQSSIGFDLTITSLFSPLLAGRTALLLPDDPGAEALATALRRQGDFSLVKITPAHLELLSRQLRPEEAGERTRAFVIGGEALYSDALSFWRANAPGTRLINEYGPTETVVGCLVYEVPEGIPTASVPIGRPIANTRVYLLDQHRQPVPIGIPGEIYIGGDGVARGYLYRPELTADRFVPDPFTDHPGARLYRTGDLARYLPDGNIEFLGRIDYQVKIRGLRIEPEEIEAVLEQHPDVRRAVVAAREDVPGDRRLVGYIVARDGSLPESAQLRDHLRRVLPDYMVPAAFVFVTELPLSSTGKVDRARLPKPESAPCQRTDGESPRTPIEKRVTEIWRSVLGVENVGLHENFFDLGGHSLLAITMVSRIEDEFGKRLPVASLFQHPTVAQVAQALEEPAKDEWAAIVPIQPNGTRVPFFCVHGFGGGVMDYKRLADLLGEDQPFYGLQARGLDGPQEPHDSVDAMAADYVKMVRALQPKGPYCLGGYCYGGVVAFEMARQLQEMGEAIGLVAILEGYARQDRVGLFHLLRPSVFVRFLANLPYWLVDNLSRPHELGHILRRLRQSEPNLASERSQDPAVQATLRTYFRAAPDVSDNQLRIMEVHSRAMARYDPRPFQGQVALFRVRSLSLFRSIDPELGWGKLAAGGVELRLFPGAHYNLLESPHVLHVAEQLRECLDRVQRTC